MDYSRLSMNGDDILSNRLRVELDRSIAKHLEAGRIVFKDCNMTCMYRTDPVSLKLDFC